MTQEQKLKQQRIEIALKIAAIDQRIAQLKDELRVMKREKRGKYDSDQ